MTIYKRNNEIINIMHQKRHIFSIYRKGKEIYSCGLTAATKSAIIAAFGEIEGNNLWYKAVAYSAYNPRITPFINEDPMLVCSLVEMNKKRYLYPDKVGNYFDTGFNAKVAPTCEVLMMATNNNDTDYWGNSSTINNAHYYADFTKTLQYYRYGTGTAINTGVALPIGEAHLWLVGKEIKLDGELRYTTSNVYTPSESQLPILIFRSHRVRSSTYKLAMFRIYDGEELCHTFVPFKRNGEMELLDIVTLKLATRVGTFTEVIE